MTVGETLYRVCSDCNADGIRRVWEGGDDVCHGCKGRGYVPVDPPEPLSDDEEVALAMAAEHAADTFTVGKSYPNDAVYLADKWCSVSEAVLAALPERYAVRREGA